MASEYKVPFKTLWVLTDQSISIPDTVSSCAVVLLLFFLCVEKTTLKHVFVLNYGSDYYEGIEAKRRLQQENKELMEPHG